MAKVKKAQFGIRTRPPIKQKSPSGKNVIRFQKNPFTGTTIIKEKDVEYATKDSPRRVYKSKTISTKDGSEREIKVLKENGKVIKRYDSKNETKKDENKTPFMLKKGGKLKKSNITPVPNGPLIKKKGQFKGSTLKNGGSTPAWTRSEGKDPKGGLNRKGVASYRRANPGSKLKMAVTTKPSKLDPNSKPAKRRRSFCARMSGVKGPMKKPNGKPTRKALALRKWNC